MQSIDGKVDKNKLNKVKVNDRSAPYIPADIEIYFYSGPNADKKAAPPPVSRPANETSPIERYADFGSDVTRWELAKRSAKTSKMNKTHFTNCLQVK